MNKFKKCLVYLLSIILFALTMLTGCSNVGSRPNIETIKDSVVMIETYDSQNNKLATGSGFSAYHNDWIVTNMHVIEGARYINVITDEGEKLSVTEVLLYSKKYDLAILKINGKLNPLTLGNTNKLKVKDKVTTIGSPRGERNTVSEGIISNVDVENEIRITAPISHGSSGGVLLNEKYEVIGITNSGYDNAQNLNFAIDVSLLEQMYRSYLRKDIDELTSENYINFIRHTGNPDGKNDLEICERPPYSSKYIFAVDSLETFHKATDKYSIFTTTVNWLLALASLDGNDSGSLYGRYFDLSISEQRNAADTYACLIDFESNLSEAPLGNTTPAEISKWQAEEYLLRLNLFDVYELAIFSVEVDEMIDKDIFIDYLNELNISYEAKIITNKLINTHDNSYNNDIVDYFNNDSSISYGQEVALLEYLGMNVDNDGNVWWD